MDLTYAFGWKICENSGFIVSKLFVEKILLIFTVYFFYSLTLTILLFMTKLPAVHELIYEEKAKKLLDFRIMEIHVQLIIKRKNILKESKII